MTEREDAVPHATSLSDWRPSVLLLLLCALLVRYMVSLWPYSGHGDEPMHGDYEAQRHWMEITTALPLHQWYSFDLEYWGLDYPPLTAYVSRACGQLARAVEPASMALGISRGYETASHKVFMRLTVVALDLAIFFPAAAALASRLSSEARNTATPARASTSSRTLLMVLLQPSLILIDHGHFQYNSVCLGLALAGAAAVSSRNRRGELIGSVFFSLSLNFKQMALYYAPAFFFFLLACCTWGPAGDKACGAKDGLLVRWTGVFGRVLGLGGVVALTFAVLWAPFCAFPNTEEGEGCLSSMMQVLTRLFPFARGLFEDKVANIWFCLDVFLKLRRRLAVAHLAKLALASTLSLLVPVGAELLRSGRRMTSRRLVLALFNSSMAFFLCSFQVHEKSLLLPLCPLAFLWEDAPLIVTWLQVIGVFSMMPLLGREGLLVPCAVCTILYVGASVVMVPSGHAADGKASDTAGRVFPYGRYVTQARVGAIVAISTAGMLLAVVLEAGWAPPESLPHLHPTLNALFCCANLTLAYALGVYWQWREGDCDQTRANHGSCSAKRDSKKGR